MSGARVLVLSTDPVTERMPGPAIRAWHLAEQLAGSNEVVLGSTVSCDRVHPEFTTRFVDITSDLHGLETWMDVIVAPAGVLGFWPALAQTDKVVVFDIYDPYHLEHLEPTAAGMTPQARNADLEIFNAAIMEHLACGDLFLCASERQRDFWLGSLMAARRVNPWTYDDQPAMENLIVVVPFGMSGEPARRHGLPLHERIDGIGPGDEIVLWGGGIYNWLDPVSVIQAVGRLTATRPTLRLVFLGAGHPNPAIPTMRVAEDARMTSDRLGLTGQHVFFNEDWVPYDERTDFLLDAKVGVTTHVDHLETRYSFRTRVLDYLWANLPMVLTSGDVLSDLVEREGLGVAVPPADPAAIAAGLDRMLDAVVPAEKFLAVTRQMTWRHVAAPLVAFCEHPRRAPDRKAQATPFNPPIVAPTEEPEQPASDAGTRREMSMRTAAIVAAVAAGVGAAVSRRR